jgi:DNA-binding transcriptional LysR family regulator
MSDIDLNDIRRLDGGLLLVFRGLLRRRRTTVVGRELGLSQSAVSHALARLRDLFGDPLFIRRPHGLEPTRRALELGPRIDALIEMAGSALARDSRFDPAKTTRRFVVSAPEFMTALIGAELVRAFQKDAPHAAIVFQSLSQETAVAGLRRGTLDLALGRFASHPSDIVRKDFYEDRYCVAARKGHPNIKGRIGFEAWRKMGHVFAASRTEEPGGIDAPDDGLDFVAAVPRWLTALAIVAASDAIATCPLRLAQSQARVFGLQVIKAPFLQDRIAVSIARRAEGADAGIDWLEARIRAAI